MKDRFPNFNQLSALVAGSVALTGCAAIGNGKMNDSELHPVAISDGFIVNGTNIRTDPVRLEDSGDGSSNACAKLGAALLFDTLTGYQSVENGYGNGSWLGFKIADVPNLTSTGCAADQDQIVWVNQKLISATVTPLQVQAVSIN